MNQRKHIRRRVEQLRKEERKSISKIMKSIFSLLLLLMCCAVMILSEKIYLAGGFDSVLTHLSSLSESLNLTQLKQWLFLEKWLDEKTAAVSSVSYQLIDHQLYETDNYEVVSISDGIVIYCGQQESGQIVMIHQDNGIIATYGLLNEVFCTEDDRVLKGTVIGKVENEVYLDFSNQGISMSYEEAISYQP